MPIFARLAAARTMRALPDLALPGKPAVGRPPCPTLPVPRTS
jgi:hypothetical protein